MPKPEIDVQYIAGLARIELSERETEDFQQQLTQILHYVEQLGTVDVETVEPTAHATEVFNVVREDVARPGFTSTAALANAPRKASDLFIVPKVIE